MSLTVAIGPSSFGATDKAPNKLLEGAGIVVKPNPFGRRLTEAEIIGHLIGVDGLIAGLEPLNHDVLSANPKLRAIARVGIGMSNVDVDSAEKFGIKVSNTPDAPTNAVAEMTVAAMLSLCRALVDTNSNLHSGKWSKSIGLGLAGTKILLLGYGRIGKKVASMLRPFEPEILVYDPNLCENYRDDQVHAVSLNEGLKQAQIISLHAGGDEAILREQEFSMMHDGVLLLNSARGELIDEQALVDALETGKVRSGWLDVFWKEPYDGELLRFNQLLLTPHVSTYTYQCRRDMETTAVKNLLRDLGLDH